MKNIKSIKLCLILGCMLYTFVTNAQIQNPVNWTFTVKKTAEKTYELHFNATLQKGWHIYSQTTPVGGPVPTTFTFTNNPLLIINGIPKEIGKLEQKHEPLFGVGVKQFSQKVDFVITIIQKTNAKTSLTGSVEYMVCNDEKCLPPKTVDFSISLK